MNQIDGRISKIFENYDKQGIHRTGTNGDNENAKWLATEISSAGLESILTPVSLGRIDILRASIRIGERESEGIPLFDCAYTNSEGDRGPLGILGSNAHIGVGELPPNWRLDDARLFLQVRREQKHQAMVAICGGPRFGMPPGIALLNAERFTEPFGPPVLQVSSEEGDWLLNAAASGSEGRLTVETNRTQVEASNVEVWIKGSDDTLAPVVVMTPRSGWFHCVSERGGGIACWLEMMRAVSAAKPRRDVTFIATTGHELGHYGLAHFIKAHPALVKDAHLWIHLGANFTAAHGAFVRFQASDTQLETQGMDAMKDAGIMPDHIRPVGKKAWGEAHNIYDGGGRYISLLGDNGLFHHPEDRWPDAVDLPKARRLIEAFTKLVVDLAQS